ncbi:hypothetical protein GCM10023321_43910 [Pseudonocardia eucalypti]|uniref:MlaB-like STAS domain-containing protein n=1 Tax=Pseudonocardia eucalypti TaxID=648755 RepID=A0ABP9QEZ2_9PSEU|nr:anti-anti-sigma regulatory factor [Pseudonocardia eucalypti]
MGITDPGVVASSRIRAYATVSVSGRLDRLGIARLRAELAGWRAAGAVDVRLDLSGVTGHDATLARTLAWAQSQLNGAGGNLLVTGADHQLRGELRDAVAALHALPGWRHDRHHHHHQMPDQRSYRPETADQP